MINKDDIFRISSEARFDEVALQLFKHQFENNKVYRSYCDLLYIHPSSVSGYRDIPCLPIGFFKSHEVISTIQPVVKVFESSGTSGAATSKHFITDLQLYEKSFRLGFERVYGSIEDYVVLALLPSYAERNNSSLIYMVNDLIKHSPHAESGFYHTNYEQLAETLQAISKLSKKTLLIGVSFALLEFVEQFRFNLSNAIVMETGGMKGRRRELVREELHHQLQDGFGVAAIHSEYGMTELLSQAYSTGDGLFNPPPWMKVLIRDPEDSFTLLPEGRTGGINIIDLANVHSCAFIETQDLGKVYEDHSFEVLGRFDHSDIRGCNLMAF